MVRDAARRDAYGPVHKGNALDGARILLENADPFGRAMRGRSRVYVTKDRPGHLRSHGRPTQTAGKTFFGMLVVDDAVDGPDFVMRFYAPKDDAELGDDGPPPDLAGTVHYVIYAQPGHRVASLRALYAQMRRRGHHFTEAEIRDAVDDLVANARLVEVTGKRNAQGFEAVLTAAEVECG
jgi:hypothetical protein